MLIICKSCKKLVDTEKYDFCPKCGANFNYSDNLNGDAAAENRKEYERNRNIERSYNRNNNYNAPKENIKLKTKYNTGNNVNNQNNNKKGCGGCLIAFIVVIIIIFSLGNL